MRRVCLLFLIGAFGGLSLAAQSVATAQIAGTVRDSSGAVIPAARIVATQTTTNFTRTASTAANGSYTLTNLPVGPYALRVTAPGFATYVQTGIVLQVASNPAVNITLRVGAQSQEVEVAADAAMVETHSTGVGDVVNQRTITELPLNGRQVTNLILLAGATAPAAGGDLNTNKNYPTQTISVAGGLINGIGYLLDGASNNDPFNSLNLPFPFPDALQEFNVQTSALPAQYGAHASAAVNVVTKSGSNNFHGDLFEFVRNGAFNANNFFNNARDLPRDSLKRNQFGGTLGGPIVHNKLYFFGGYQGTVTRSDPNDRVSTGVTPDMLNGNFTAFTSALCQGKAVALKAPFVVTKDASGNIVSETIDPTLFNSAALKFLQHIPVSTNPCGTLNYGISQNSHDNDIVGRVDYTMSSRQSMFVRYYYAHYVLPIGAGAATNILEANQVAQNDQDQTTTFGDNYSLSPNSVNVFTLSLARTYAYRQIPPYPDPADLGIPVFSPIPHFMGISVSGAFSLGAGGTNPGHFNSTAPQIADDFTTIHGSHQIQLGVSWEHAIMNTVNNRPTNGAFSFGNAFTGLGLTDFLMGDLSNFLQGNPDWENDRENLLGVYAQDSWKLSPRLSLSYGLRWEPLFQQYNWNQNRWVENFDLTRFENGVRSSVYANAPAGLLFPGDAGYPGNAAYSYNRAKDTEPRAGIIWDPTGSGRTSLRASYGMFFDRPQMFFYTRMSNNPPWGASINLTDPPGGFSNPWQGYPGGNPWPTLAAVSPNMPFPQAGVYVNVPLRVKPTYVQQWNLSAQHQLGNNDVLSASYIGNGTTHLWLGTELNPALYSPSCATNYNKCHASTNARRLLNTLNPTWGPYFSTIGSVDDGGTASYNALLLSEQHRLHSGLSFRFNYTWAHCITDPATTELTGPTYDNPANRRMDRGNCGSDIRQTLNASMVGDSPFHWHGLGELANDWRLSINFTANTGTYSTAGLGGPITDPMLNGIGSRAQVAAGQQVLAPTLTNVGNQGNLQYLNPNAFTVPAIGSFGDAGVATIPNPGMVNFDTALSRLVHVSERHTVELRWEMFNALNAVNLGAPSTGFGGPNVGQISTAADPRIMQFALKYAF